AAMLDCESKNLRSRGLHDEGCCAFRVGSRSDLLVRLGLHEIEQLLINGLPAGVLGHGICEPRRQEIAERSEVDDGSEWLRRICADQGIRFFQSFSEDLLAAFGELDLLSVKQSGAQKKQYEKCRRDFAHGHIWNPQAGFPSFRDDDEFVGVHGKWVMLRRNQ